MTQPGSHKQSRGEKRSRKAMQKLGMRPVGDIVRVTIKKSKEVLFVIAQPEVYKSPSSDTYIVFGEARYEDLGAQQRAQLGNAAQQFNRPDAMMGAGLGAGMGMPRAAETKAPEVDDGPVDETGIEAKDVELIISQIHCTRAQAVRALKANNGDIVNAIMSLTG